jgi:hypothetical protein
LRKYRLHCEFAAGVVTSAICCTDEVVRPDEQAAIAAFFSSGKAAICRWETMSFQIQHVRRGSMRVEAQKKSACLACVRMFGGRSDFTRADVQSLTRCWDRAIFTFRA